MKPHKKPRSSTGNRMLMHPQVCLERVQYPFSPDGQTLMFSHRKHTSQHTLDISKFCWAAVQMFLLCTFLWGVSSLRCQREYCELKRAPRSFFFSFSPPLDTLESSLLMDTCCAVSSWKHHRLHLGRHSVQAGGFTESSNSKGCWSQLLAQRDKADNWLYMGLSLPMPCHYLSISSFVFELLFLRDTLCCIF